MLSDFSSHSVPHAPLLVIPITFPSHLFPLPLVSWAVLLPASFPQSVPNRQSCCVRTFALKPPDPDPDPDSGPGPESECEPVSETVCLQAPACKPIYTFTVTINHWTVPVCLHLGSPNVTIWGSSWDPRQITVLKMVNKLHSLTINEYKQIFFLLFGCHNWSD